MGDSIDQALAISCYNVERCYSTLYQHEKAIEAGEHAPVYHRNDTAKRSSDHSCPSCLATVHYYPSDSFLWLQKYEEALESVQISIGMERRVVSKTLAHLSQFLMAQSDSGV